MLCAVLHRSICRLIKTIGFERGIDTLVWQLIASVATPGYTIHTVVAIANWALARAEESSQVRTGILGSQSTACAPAHLKAGSWRVTAALLTVLLLCGAAACFV